MTSEKELKRRIQQFMNWLTERERRTIREMKAKGWGNTKMEVSVIREKFEEMFRSDL